MPILPSLSPKYSIQHALNLIIYMTEHPHTLTHNQRITRLYRCLLRREKEWTIDRNKCYSADYYRNIGIARQKMDALLAAPNDPLLFQNTLQYFEQRIRNNLDLVMVMKDMNLYSVSKASTMWHMDLDVKFEEKEEEKFTHG